METLFGKGRWVYWAGMAILVAGIVVVLKVRPSAAEVARKRVVWGDKALDAGKYEQAVAFYEKALAKDPTLLNAHYNKAYALEFIDETKAAAAWDEYLKKAEADPTQAEWVINAKEHRARLRATPYLARGTDLAAKGDRAGARDAFVKGLAYCPDDLEGLTAAAANEAAAGDYKAAASYYERALVVAPYSMKTKYKAAEVYDHFDKAKAAALWADVVEKAKTRPDLTTEEVKEAQKRLAALKAEGYHG